MNNRKLVLFDIDYTLIDTDILREKVNQKIAGILNKETEEIKKISLLVEEKVWQEKSYFDPLFFSQLISLHFQKPQLEKTIRDVFFEKLPVEESLYPEVLKILDILSEKHLLGIFSEGDLDFQTAKIRKSRLSSFLKKEFCYIFFKKIPALPKILETHPNQALILVDDKLSVIKEAEKYFPKIIGVWIKREKKYERETVDFLPKYAVKTLSELESLI